MRKQPKLGLIPALVSALVFGQQAFDSSANAQDLDRDLAVSFSAKHKGGKDPGFVFGTVTNKSSRPYPCVRLEFDLYTRFDMRQDGEKSRHLGVLETRVRNLQPRSVSDFKEALPSPAGMGLKSVSVCRESPPGQEGESEAEEPVVRDHRTGNGAPPPPPRTSDKSRPNETVPAKRGKPRDKPRDKQPPPASGDTASGACIISGQLSGNWRQSIQERPKGPASIWVVDVLILAHGSRKPVAEATVNDNGRYLAKNLPAGNRYVVKPVWKSEPGEAEVACVSTSTINEGEPRVFGQDTRG